LQFLTHNKNKKDNNFLRFKNGGDVEDVISNLTNTNNDTKILLLNKLKEMKKNIYDSFRKEYQEKEQEMRTNKKENNKYQKKIINIDKTKENKMDYVCSKI